MWNKYTVKAAGRQFSQGTPFYSTNKTDLHDLAEILLKVALNTTAQTSLFEITMIARMSIFD
jgi:hypothetical protein